MAAISRNKKWERPAAIPFLTDFFYKTRNREFVAEHGPEAMLAVLQIWCEIAREKSLKFDSAKIKYIPFMQKNDFSPLHDWYEKVFFAAVEKGLLECDGEKYFNSQITKFVKESSTYGAAKNTAKNQKSNGEKSSRSAAKNKSRAFKGGLGGSLSVSILKKSSLKQEKDPTRISISNLKHLEDPSTKATAKNTAKNQISIGEKYGEKSKRGRPANDLPELPRELDTISNRAAWQEFLAYRRNIKRKSVSAAAAKKIFAEFILCPDDFSPAINRSIKNDWIGIFAEQKTATAKNKKTTVDRNMELLRADAEKEISDE